MRGTERVYLDENSAGVLCDVRYSDTGRLWSLSVLRLAIAPVSRY